MPRVDPRQLDQLDPHSEFLCRCPHPARTQDETAETAGNVNRVSIMPSLTQVFGRPAMPFKASDFPYRTPSISRLAER